MSLPHDASRLPHGCLSLTGLIFLTGLACGLWLQVLYKIYEAAELQPLLDAANAEKEAASAASS